MRQFLRKRWWIIILVIAAVAAFGWWRMQTSKPTYTTTNPKVQSISQTIELSGVVDAEEKASIPYGAGKIGWVGVKEDQPVKKWQTLASMDTRILQKQQQQDLNTFGKVFRQRDQTLEDLNYYEDTNPTLEEKRAAESADLDIRNSALTVEIRDLTIKQSSLVSPINGIITRLDKPYGGVYAGVTDVIEVVNPTTVYFSAIVDEVDIAQIKIGQAVNIELDAYPDTPVASTISKIDFAASQSKNGGTGYKIHIPLPFDNANLRYRLGMNGTAIVTLAEKTNVLTVPVDSLITREDKTYIDALENSKAVQKEVTVGLETADTAEIISGINQQTLVILPQAAENK